MGKKIWAVAAIGAVALAVGVALGAAMWAGGDHGGGMEVGAQDGTMGMGGAAMDERDFLEQMIPHHEAAIEMAGIALRRAQRPEIIALAQEISSSQEEEIRAMQARYRGWYGEDLASGMDADGHGHMDLGDLETARGSDFDRMFLRMMLPHHAGAIMMADAVMMDSPREEVRMLAGEITATQAKEIGQMQRWREAWFPPLG